LEGSEIVPFRFAERYNLIECHAKGNKNFCRAVMVHSRGKRSAPPHGADKMSALLPIIAALCRAKHLQLGEKFCIVRLNAGCSIPNACAVAKNLQAVICIDVCKSKRKMSCLPSRRPGLEASFSNCALYWIEKGFLLNDTKPRIAFRFHLFMQSSITCRKHTDHVHN